MQADQRKGMVEDKHEATILEEAALGRHVPLALSPTLSGAPGSDESWPARAPSLPLGEEAALVALE